VTWPVHLLRERTTPDDYLCEFDHVDFERACESVLWHGRWEEQTAQVLDVLGRLDVLHDEDAALDYGCGVGRVAKAVRSTYDVEITAADRSLLMLLHAARYLRGCHKVQLCTDQEALRMTKTFAAILAVEVLQHIPQAHLFGVVRGLVDRLAHDGKLFVYGNEHLDVDVRGMSGVTPVRVALETVCRVVHHEVVPRWPGAAPDRHVFLCTRA